MESGKYGAMLPQQADHAKFDSLLPAHRSERGSHDSRSKKVLRQRLLDLIEGHELAPITLITAPAGYGKSTIAHQWVSQHPDRACGWCQIRAEHNSYGKFLTHLWHVVDVAIGEELPPPEISPGTILGRLQQHRAPIVLVLDDYHRIENDQVHAFVAQLARGLPPNAHLLVSSRSVPGISVARLRVLGQVRHIGEDDLAFTIEEIEQVFADKGFDKELLARLTERAAGWITGVQLTLMTIDSDAYRTPNQIDRVRDSIAVNPLLDSYIVEEVLNALPDDLRQFVLDTAALINLEPDLCDAVLGIDRSRAFLRQLEDRHVFVSRPNGIGTPLVYLDLFAECVLHVRRRYSNERSADELRLRAAQWHRDRGDYEQAARYALAASAWPLAAELIRAILPGSTATAYALASYDWLRQLPEEYYRDDPVLSSNFLTLMLKCGRYNEARALFETTARLYESALDPASAGWRAVQQGMLAFMDGNYDDVVRQCNRALSLLPPDAADGRLFAAVGIYRVEAVRGNTEAAHEALNLVAQWRNNRSREFPYWYPAILPDMVNSAAVRGDLPDAISMAHQFLTGLSGSFSDSLTPIRIRLLALVLEQNRLDLAEELADEIMRHLRTSSYRAWFPRADAILSRYFLACDEPDRAWDVIDRSLKSTRRYGGAALIRKAETSAANFWLHAGQPGLSAHLAYRIGADADLVAEFGEIEPRTVRLRLLMRDGNLLQAQDLATRSRMLARDHGNVAAEIEFLVWSSVLARAMGDSIAADSDLRSALELGAPGGFVRVYASTDVDLTDAIRALLPGLSERARAHARTLLGEPEQVEAATDVASWNEAGLTAREREVLAELISGKSNREIAEALYITERTVKKHLASLFRKSGASNRMMLALWAQEQMTG